jgi:hypothetical protein
MILIWCFAGVVLAWLSGPRLKVAHDGEHSPLPSAVLCHEAPGG